MSTPAPQKGRGESRRLTKSYNLRAPAKTEYTPSGHSPDPYPTSQATHELTGKTGLHHCTQTPVLSPPKSKHLYQMLQDCPPSQGDPGQGTTLSSLSFLICDREEGLETPTYYVPQARVASHAPHSQLVESPNPPMPGAQLGPGSPHVTTGRAGLSTPPPSTLSTPRLLRLCPSGRA